MGGRGTRLLTIAGRAFRMLLRILPADFRRRHGGEMAALFDELAAEALGRRGPRALVALWLRSSLDLLLRAPAEHLANLRRRTRERNRARPRRAARRSDPRTPAHAMDTLLQDVRYGLRSLAGRPGFTAMVAATFALGIGANTAMFSVVNGVLLRDLPYEDADRIVHLLGTNFETGTISWPNFDDVRKRGGDLFAAAAAYDEWQPNLTGTGEPERLDAALVSTPLFRVLGVEPALGRFFVPEEDVDGQDRVVVLSHGFWQRKFGGDPSVIGRAIDLNGTPHTVVGVAPRELEDPRLSGPRWGEPMLWRPLGFVGVEPDRLPNRGSSSYTAIARLRPGVSLDRTRDRLAALSRQLEEEYPEENAGVGMTAVPLRDSMVGDVRTSLIVLLGLVGFVLAIAAANVGNLLLGRMTDRRHEIAVRSAMGATRVRLLRQLVTETLVLAMLGGALGVAVALATTGVLVDLGGEFIPRSRAIGVDLAVLGFALGVSLLTGLICGLAPAVLISSEALRAAVGGGLRSTGGRRSRRFRGSLMAAEVALALMLLTGAGLLTRSFYNLTRVDPGIETAHVLTFDLAPPFNRYREPQQVTAFYDRLLERLEGVPEVEDAALVNIVPLSGNFDSNTIVPADRPPPHPGEETSAQTRTVSADYFRVMRIDLRRGRGFEPTDQADSPPVVVVDETLARRLWPDRDPIGRRVSVAGTADAEIVGVVADVKHARLEEPAPPHVYISRHQGFVTWQLRRVTVVLRVSGDPGRVVPSLRAAVRELDPELPIAKLRTMDRIVADATAPPRFRTFLLGSFAVLALVLAALGIYGVISYSASQRLREMAIRMALGARADAVVRQMMGEGLRTVAVGVAVGLAGALLLTRSLSAFLYDVPATDPLVFGAVVLCMIAIAAAAILVPARRVGRVDPVAVLRDE